MTDWSQYDSFLKEAEKDDRIGLHKFMVESAGVKKWEKNGQSGQLFAVKGVLLTANKASADFTIPDHDPTLEELAKAKAEGKSKGIGFSMNLARSLEEKYNITRENIKAGDEFYVETYKQKDGGFIRVNRIVEASLAEARLAKEPPKPKSDVPF